MAERFFFYGYYSYLNILFKIDTKVYEYNAMDWGNLDKDVLINNAYYWISNFVLEHGAFLTLVMMGCILVL